VISHICHVDFNTSAKFSHWNSFTECCFYTERPQCVHNISGHNGHTKRQVLMLALKHNITVINPTLDIHSQYLNAIFEDWCKKTCFTMLTNMVLLIIHGPPHCRLFIRISNQVLHNHIILKRNFPLWNFALSICKLSSTLEYATKWPKQCWDD